MSMHHSQPWKTKTLRVATASSLGGAIAGCGLGSMILSGVRGPADMQERAVIIAAFAFTLALLGAAAGARMIRKTGWLMLAAAILGGIAAVLVTGIGKALLYGTPVGAIIGLVCGLNIERGIRKSSEEAKSTATNS